MFTLDLPKPPSLNSANKIGRGRVYSSKAKKAWFTAAGKEIQVQKPKSVKGPFWTIITISKEGRRSNEDLDNRPKYVLDLLQKHGLIENDCLQENMFIQWGQGAPLGCCVRVYEWTE